MLPSFDTAEKSRIRNFEFVAEECWERCGNSCIINHDQNAYCNFCIFEMEKLPCPKEGKITYEDIQASEKDMKH